MRIWLINELLLWLIVANGTPVLLALMVGKRGNRPLDGGRLLADQRPLFGPSKTIRGIAVAVIASTLAAPLVNHDYATGAMFGTLAMLGDLLSSFIKRRMGLGSGDSCPLLDQLPETVLPLAILQPVLGVTVAEMLAAIVAFTVIDLLASRVIRRH
jgi:hypothetical protein